VYTRTLNHNSDIWSAHFSPDSQKIISASGELHNSNGDYTIRIWSTQTGECEQTLVGHLNAVKFAEFSPDSHKIVSASQDRTVRVWAVMEKTVKQTRDSAGHTESVMSAHFGCHTTGTSGRRGDSMIVSASEDTTVRVWSAETGECKQELKGHNGEVNSAQFSADGRLLVSASADSTVRIWSDPTGSKWSEREWSPMQHDGCVKSAYFSQGGDKIVSASHDKTVRVWNAETGECMLKLTDHHCSVKSAQFSQNGKKIVSVDYEAMIRIWCCEFNADMYGQCQHAFRPYISGLNSVQFSPMDGLKIVLARHKTVQVWSVETKKCEQNFEGHGAQVHSAKFSSDGKMIVSASTDETVRVWCAETGRCKQTLLGHSKAVMSAEFSRDGKSVVSASEDKTVRVWDMIEPHNKTTHGSFSLKKTQHVEIWKPIIRKVKSQTLKYDYEVSNLGRIRKTVSQEPVNLTSDKTGFMQCSLKRKYYGQPKIEKIRVPTLVLESFVNDCPPQHEFEHKNFNKKDNCRENLRWILKGRRRWHSVSHKAGSMRGLDGDDTAMMRNSLGSMQRPMDM
jgi:WD40 repeat protein